MITSTTPIAINVLKNTSDEKIINKLICFNISCFTIFPFTIITLREKMGGINNFKVYIVLLVITFLTTLFGIIICNIGYKK